MTCDDIKAMEKGKRPPTGAWLASAIVHVAHCKKCNRRLTAAMQARGPEHIANVRALTNHYVGPRLMSDPETRSILGYD
jgi:hypothetical protein